MADKMPIVSVTGPRQSGKTTLVRASFPEHYYVNLELPESRRLAIEDPKAFLGHGRMIIDEAQRVPELFSYLQVLSDESGRTGQYVLSGSQNFLLMKTISQSLAGRVFVSHLLPLSLGELRRAGLLEPNLNTVLFRGFYPRLFDRQIEPEMFYPSYNLTYLERDVAGLIAPSSMNHFRKFMELLAGRVGQLINYSSLSIDVGVDHKTIQAWCSLLEAGFMIYFLRPYHKNYSKRMVKSPKIYFYDTGLACHLLGIRSPGELERHWARGALFENMIIADIIKDYQNRAERPPIYFWRDSRGLEVDLLIEESGAIKAIEIKSGTTITSEFFSSLQKFTALAGRGVSAYVVYGGSSRITNKQTTVLPWTEKERLLN
jgi:hypothetical protein